MLKKSVAIGFLVGQIEAEFNQDCGSLNAEALCNTDCETSYTNCVGNCLGDASCVSGCNRQHGACMASCPCHDSCLDGCPCDFDSQYCHHEDCKEFGFMMS